MEAPSPIPRAIRASVADYIDAQIVVTVRQFRNGEYEPLTVTHDGKETKVTADEYAAACSLVEAQRERDEAALIADDKADHNFQRFMERA